MGEKNKLLEEIKILLDEGKVAIDKAINKNLILILGGTGCGKSTAINYLAGCEMKEVEDEDTGISYIECVDPVAEIGSGAVSQTLYPNIVDMRREVEGMDAKLCDTAGFSDNRGVAHDISAAVSLGEVFRNSASICGVVVLIPEADILEARLTKVLDLFQQLNMCLHKENFRGSITFFISKSFLGRTEKQIYNVIRKKYEQLCESPENNIKDKAWLFEELLKGEGKNIHLCKPLEAEQREGLLKEVIKLEEVKDKTSAFQYPISADARLVLDTLIKDIQSSVVSRLEVYVKEYTEDFIKKVERVTMIQEMSKYERVVDIFKNWLESSVNAESITLDKFINLLSGESGLFLEDTCIKLQNEIRRNLDIIKDLNKYTDHGNAEISLSSVYMESIIEKTSKSIMEQKFIIIRKKIEEILVSYEVQKQVWTLSNRDKLMEVANKTDYIYSKRDFEPILKNLTDRNSEELEANITRLNAYGEKGNEIIRNLVSKYILNPFIIKSFILKEKTVIEVKALIKNLVISSVLEAFRNRNVGDDVSTIMFLAKDTIYMDINLGMDFASEKNIIISCENLDVSSNSKINVSGKSGNLIDNSIYGINGEDGRDAGNIYLYIKEEIRNYRLTLIANGGNGSRGTDGKDGVAGSTGRNGSDAGYTSYFYGQMFKGYFAEGTSGAKGGKGEKGGNAGRGGNGGSKGNIYFLADSDKKREKLISCCDITVRDGERGPDGRPGFGGSGGKGGHHGYNTLSFSPSAIDSTVYYTGYFKSWDYKLTSITSYRITLEGGSWEKGKEGPSREYADYGDRGESGGYNNPNYKKSTAVLKVEESFVKEKYQNYCAEV
ncbi:ATP-binding protein [Clostridioides sp. ES-S-0123-01]|uniref:ATP-binding protein n=1 Tax=unclassified Clostridioides TaxID=2635829 RepID=UPI001D103B93|nr:ATP-binding protein [Clostridioides sp. ES-S-0123-01]UDN57922.1 ATP-binding protein [Clostridioides sp. ES-S-0010-02]